MKTFKQFIMESSTDAKELIEGHCASFLSQAKGAGFLCRGVKDFHTLDYDVAVLYDGRKTTYATKNVRKDRRPLTSTREIHEYADEWFDKKFGFKARSTTMFSFGKLPRSSLLTQYGTPCIVFPVGSVRYVWSPKVRDLVVSMPIERWVDQGYKGEELRTLVNEFLEKQEYRDDGLDEAINTVHEIMVECDKYYAFEYSNKMDLQITLDILPD